MVSRETDTVLSLQF